MWCLVGADLVDARSPPLYTITMSRTIYSAKSEGVTASCGHQQSVAIPPSGGPPGPVGQRNIVKAQSRPCYKCRNPEEAKQSKIEWLMGERVVDHALGKTLLKHKGNNYRAVSVKLMPGTRDKYVVVVTYAALDLPVDKVRTAVTSNTDVVNAVISRAGRDKILMDLSEAQAFKEVNKFLGNSHRAKFQTWDPKAPTTPAPTSTSGGSSMPPKDANEGKTAKEGLIDSFTPFSQKPKELRAHSLSADELTFRDGTVRQHDDGFMVYKADDGVHRWSILTTDYGKTWSLTSRPSGGSKNPYDTEHYKYEYATAMGAVRRADKEYRTRLKTYPEGKRQEQPLPTVTVSNPQIAHGAHEGESTKQLQAKIKEARAEIKSTRQWGGRHQDRTIGRLQNRIANMQDQIKAGKEQAKANKASLVKTAQKDVDEITKNKAEAPTTPQTDAVHIKNVKAAVLTVLDDKPTGMTQWQITKATQDQLVKPVTVTQVNTALKTLEDERAIVPPITKAVPLVMQKYTLTPPDTQSAKTMFPATDRHAQNMHEQAKVPFGEGPGPTVDMSTAVDTTEAAKQTGYSEYRTKLMAKEGKLVGAYKVKGRWMIPTPVMIRAKDGREVPWVKSSRLVNPQVSSSPQSMAVSTKMTSGRLTWNLDRNDVDLKQYVAYLDDNIRYTIWGYKDKETGAWAYISEMASKGGHPYYDDRWHEVTNSHHRSSKVERFRGRGGHTSYTGKPYKNPKAAMNWAEGKAETSTNIKESFAKDKERQTRMTNLKPAPEPAPRPLPDSGKPLTQESLNSGRRA